MNRIKGNVTFKSPARMRGHSRIGGQPDGKRMMMDQRCDPGQHIRKQKHHGNRLLCCPAPERQYVPGVGQGHNHVILMNSQTPRIIPSIFLLYSFSFFILTRLLRILPVCLYHHFLAPMSR